MIRLTICNHKGGTGKTTTSIHVAAALGLSGFRTLVVDLDPQGFLTRTLGIAEPAVRASSLMLFDVDTPLHDVPVESMNQFDVLPASTQLTKFMRKLNKPTDVLWAREAIEQTRDYDVILFDTAAAITVYSLNALVASRHALIPVTPEYQPVLGAEQTFSTVQMVREKLNPDLNAPLFLFTQVDARKRNHHTYRRYLRDQYGDRIMKSIIRTSTALSTSYGDGTTVFEREPHSRGARDYANATDELLQRLEVDAPERTRPGKADAPPVPGEAQAAEAVSARTSKSSSIQS